MSFRSLLTFLCGIIGFPLMLFSQSVSTIKTVTLPSPNAASLGKFGETPVSFYTGIPQISIPLHTVKTSDLALPISLGYHAGGLKLEEIPSSVGTGWTLNIGGVITRSIRGSADKYTGSNHYQTMANMGALYGFSNAFRAPTDAGNCGVADKFVALDVANGVIDGQPDVYYFNFLNFSGSFFLSQSGNFVISSKQAIAISYTNNTTTQEVEQWVLIDADGIKYYFGKSQDGTRNGREVNDNGPGFDPITGWSLMDIVAPKGDKIKFTYVPKSYTYDTRGGETMNYQLVASSSDAPSLNQQEIKYITNNMTEARISLIEFPNGKIEVASINNRTDLTGCPTIDTIKVFNLDNPIRPYKKIFFEYAYDSYLGGRLTLKSVQELSPFSTGNGNKHTFTYDNTGTLPSLNVHATAINSQDLWGFYNGVVNSVFPPAHVLNFNGTNINMGGASRYANFPTTKVGILTSIRYPTGGTTDFEYEGNTVYSNLLYDGVPLVPDSKVAATNYGVGGSAFVDFTIANSENGKAKVQVMSHSQTSGCPLEPYTGISACNSSYIQGRNGTVYGPKLLPEGSSSLELPNGNYRLGGQGNIVAGQPGTNNFYLSAQWNEYPQLSGQTSANKNVGGLRILRIKNTDGNGNVIGLKKYLYSQFTDNTKSSGVLVSFPAPHLKVFFTVGATGPSVFHRVSWAQIKSDPIVPLVPTGGSVLGYENVTVLEGENGENGKTEYTYVTSKDARDIICYYRPFPPPQSMEFKRGRTKREVVYRNLGGSFVPIQSVDYQYSELSKIEKGIGVVVENQIAAISGTAAAFQTEEHDIYVSGAEVQSEILNLSQKTTRTYPEFNPSSYHETVENYEYDTTNGHYQLKKTIVESSKGQTVETINYYPQDFTLPAGNAETARASMVSSHIWSPVVREKTLTDNVATFDVNNYYKVNGSMILPESSEVQRSSGPFHKTVQFLKYDANGNILQQQKFKDAINFIIWDYNSELPIATIVNPSETRIDSMAYTSFESNGKGNWIFSGTIITDATAPTGRKCYFLGSNITKSGLSTTTTYIVSYWKKTGSVSVNGTTPSTGRSVRGWTYYEHKVVNPASGLITVSGSSALIDELRLYPLNAQMTTYAYKSGIGINSQCDPNNSITYFEYDNFNRLMVTRDQDYNILKRHSYTYDGQTESTALVYNAQLSKPFISSCSGCTLANSVNYLVPSGTYLAPTQQIADQLALEDANANGQTYANAFPSCITPVSTSIKGSNSLSISFTVQFHNTNSNCSPINYNYTVNAGASMVTLGSVTESNYDVIFSAGTNPSGYTYRVNGFTLHANGGTINADIRNTGSNQVGIQP